MNKPRIEIKGNLTYFVSDDGKYHLKDISINPSNIEAVNAKLQEIFT